MQKDSSKKLAIVTGANRGLGLATAEKLHEKGFEVIFASRNQAPTAHYVELDVSDENSLKKFCERVETEWGHLEVLVNNAGIYLDRSGELADRKTLLKTFETNVLGAYELCKSLAPLMAKKNYGRIVNVSSGMGQLSEMAGGSAAYRISKTALNAVTKIFSEEFKQKGLLVNSVCPGWVKTDMGGAGAPRSIEQGIETIVWAATLPSNGPSGGFFRDLKAIPW